MAAFFRGLLLFLFGAIVGAGGMLFFTPSFNVVVSRAPGARKLIEFTAATEVAANDAAAPASSSPQARPTAASKKYPTFAQPTEASAATPATPANPTPVATSTPAAPVTPATEPALDFKSISEHLILWPTTVSVKAATTVAVLVDGKKAQDLALEAGTVLQVSKVLADGSLEVRAKGAKFEIKSALTDFNAELGKRVAELVAKGTKFDSPYPVASAAPATPAAPVAPAMPAVAAVVPKGPLTLAQRVDILFGNKPEVAAPATVVAPTPAPAAPAVTAPVAEVAPAPSADPKAAEKGKDLDRKLNQLFK
jgi:hypothetical protein